MRQKTQWQQRAIEKMRKNPKHKNQIQLNMKLMLAMKSSQLLKEHAFNHDFLMIKWPRKSNKSHKKSFFYQLIHFQLWGCSISRIHKENRFHNVYKIVTVPWLIKQRLAFFFCFFIRWQTCVERSKRRISFAGAKCYNGLVKDMLSYHTQIIFKFKIV